MERRTQNLRNFCHYEQTHPGKLYNILIKVETTLMNMIRKFRRIKLRNTVMKRGSTNQYLNIVHEKKYNGDPYDYDAELE